MGKRGAGTIMLSSKGGSLRATTYRQDNDTPLQPQSER